VTPASAETRAERAPNGRFLPGHQVTLKAGIARFKNYGALEPELAEARAADLAGLVADRGGAAALSTAETALVERAANVITLCRLYERDLAARGPFTPRGRVRATTTGYLAAIGTLQRLLSTIGLERRPRQVDSGLGWLHRSDATPAEAEERP